LPRSIRQALTKRPKDAQTPDPAFPPTPARARARRWSGLHRAIGGQRQHDGL